MFERYTERARRVLFFARYEATEFGSSSIEPEHLLLGLIREGKGLTSRLFAVASISLDAVRQALKGRMPRGEKIPTSIEMPFSASVKRILQYAVEEADGLGHSYIGTEHLLLGVLRDKQSLAGSVLLDLGLQADAVRTHLVAVLNEQPAGTLQPEMEVRFDTPQGLAQENARLRAFIEDMLKDPGLPIEFRDNAYWLRRGGQTADGPYCTVCFDIDRRFVRMLTVPDGTTCCEYCTKYRPRA